MASGRKPSGGPRPEINVTPLVDVVLVLLIIFMVIAPQLEGGMHVELPGIFHPDPKLKGSLEPLTITINAEGAFYLDKAPISAEDLEKTLRERHATDDKQRVMLKGDQGLKYGAMRDLFHTCQAIGFPGISLVVSDRARHGKDDPAEPADTAGGAETGAPHGL